MFIGGILPEDPGADIEAQTHSVFQALGRRLAEAGAGMADLVRLNTYYVYDGAESEATRYWERMTRVRLLYFPDPGPVGTAVRIHGLPGGALIQIEAEAVLGGAARQRIMPAESWDWSMPLPLSQGWRIGERIWVGGQIAADRKGRAIHLGDPVAQTLAVIDHIRNVLRDGGGGTLTHLKVCYRHDGDLDLIMKTIESVLSLTGLPVTAFGVKLLYEGLELEIDAEAAPMQVRVGGQGADLPAALRALGVPVSNLLKLSIFYTPGKALPPFEQLCPAVTAVRVASLPGGGESVLVDGVLKGEA